MLLTYLPNRYFFNVNGHINIDYIIYLSEFHRKAPIPITDKVMNASSRFRWSSDGTLKSERTGLGGDGSNCLPVTRKYCCIAKL